MNECELCYSSWGDYWEVVGGRNLFFCCKICAIQYKGVLDAIKFHTGWTKIDHINFEGNSRKRIGEALSGEKKMEFSVSFQNDGQIWTFQPH